MSDHYRIGSLFSGVGGLELGLEWSGLGETIWQVEIDPFCRSILARHWPNVTRYEDVKKVGTTNLAPVDIICGGFPCQDVSSAGKGAGLAGERSGLWFEFARILVEMRPEWVVVENVASGATRWVDTVVAGLEQQGWTCLPIPLSARDVGAPHRRERIFVVGHADRRELRQQSRRSCRAGRSDTRDPGDDGAQRETADASGKGLQGADTVPRSATRAQPPECPWSIDAMPQPAIRRVDDGLPRKLDSARLRNQRLKALGNAVVPQCAEVIGWVIKELARI
jgi:DNA (cytosine-5)-methyltransferase 1